MKNIQIQSQKLPIILAVYFAVVFNLSFFSYLIKVLQSLDHFPIGFMITVVISFIAGLNALFTLINIKYINKPLIILLLFFSSIVSYQQYFYGVIFNADMIDTIIQSNFSEGSSFLNYSIIFWIIITGIIPSILLYRSNITYLSCKKSIINKLISCAASILIIGSGIAVYYIDYASVGRNNTRLINLPVPTYFISSIVKYIQQNHFKKHVVYINKGLDAKNNHQYDGKSNLLVILLGETARSMNYELNGYSRPTNSHTKKFDVISFKNVSSCGTLTSESVPCMFSNLTRKEYSRKIANHQDNLLDIMQHAGLNLSWLDNDSGCKDVCNRIKNVKIKPSTNQFCDNLQCNDGILTDKLQSEINSVQDKTKDTVIVLHLIGSHGPTYYKRYPKENKQFRPDCSRSDIQNCTNEQLINTYDNTILYTDYIMSKTIEILESNNKLWRPAVVYISDHGESLGENGLYLHGTPYFMAPKEQTSVPWIVWLSESFAKKNHVDTAVLKQKINEPYSHDNFFSSILGLMQIQTKEYTKGLDIFHNQINVVSNNEKSN